MKKQLVIVGMVVLLLCVGLSGCNQNTENQVEVKDYEVTTHWYYGSGDDYKEYSEEGFFHDYPVDASSSAVYYQIVGNLTNVAGKLLNSVTIDVILYDENGVELFNSANHLLQDCVQKGSVTNLPDTYVKEFTVRVYKSCLAEYFDNVSSFKFVFSAR